MTIAFILPAAGQAPLPPPPTPSFRPSGWSVADEPTEGRNLYPNQVESWPPAGGDEWPPQGPLTVEIPRLGCIEAMGGYDARNDGVKGRNGYAG